MTAGIVRIGTRGSPLARRQSALVVDALAAAGIAARLVTVETAGDRRPADAAWGEGAFVGALEAALLADEIDVAVHSAKDVPTDEDPRLRLAAFLPRADPADVLVVRAGAPAPASLADLPRGTRVGTDSPRRTAFLRAANPGLVVHPLHGNVDTRLRRLDDGETDALVLAAAGLDRLGLADRIALRLDPAVVPPAAGQGALAIQVRAGSPLEPSVALLDHAPTRAAVTAERSLLAATGGGCRAPVGVLATANGDRVRVTAGYARSDGAVRAIVERSGLEPAPGLQLPEIAASLVARAASASLAAGGTPMIITRPGDQVAATALALIDRGIAPLLVPAIERRAAQPGPLQAIAATIGAFDWVVLTSAAAVGPLRTAMDAAGRSPGATRPSWAAIGRATAAAMRAAGMPASFRPSAATAEALAAELPVRAGDRVLLCRSDIAQGRLADGLAARGAEVADLVAYRTIEAPAGSDVLLVEALDRSPRAVVYTSGSTVRGLAAIAERVGPRAAEAILALPAVVIGAATERAAEQRGLTIVARATDPVPAAIAAAAASLATPVEIR